MADPGTMAVKAALMVAQMALTATQKIKGPRLKSLDVQLSEYGTPIPHFWGKRRLEGLPIIWAEKLREKKTTSKTKGGKYSDYKYFGTWGLVVCDHEFESVSRIWFDKHLVYDVTGVGPVTPLGKDGLFNRRLKLGQNMRIYYGTETQEVDPRYAAWCEDRYGSVDYATAYRGYGIIVFENLPLEKFGNRIPQVSIEAIRTKTTIYPYETVPSDFTMQRALFTNGGRMILVDINDAIQTWDVANRTPLLSFPTTANSTVGVNTDGIIYGYDFLDGTRLIAHTVDGGSAILTDNFESSFLNNVYVIGTLVCITPSVVSQTLYYDPEGNVVRATDVSFRPNAYFADEDSFPWAVGEVPGQNKVGFASMPYGGDILVDGPASGAAFAMDNGVGSWLVWQDDTLFLVNKDTMTAGAGVAAPATDAQAELAFRNVQRSAASIWIHNTEYSTTTGEEIRSVDLGDWVAGGIGALLYDPISHALIGDRAEGITWYYLDRVGNTDFTLGDVLEETATLVGIEEVDASAQTQPIHGYSVVQGPGKDWIAPLLDLHDVDPRPHDFGLQFVNRGGAIGSTISTVDLVRQGDEARYVISVTQDTDLPRKVTVTFADGDKDQQANVVVSQRPLLAIDGVREETIDLKTYVSFPEEAQPLSDRRLRRIWNGRGSVQCTVTAQELSLEPADVRNLQLDDVEWSARLTKLTLTAGAIKTEWERDFPGLATLNTASGPVMEGRDPEVIYVPGQTKGFVLDIPLVTDNDNSVNPLLYYGAGSYSVGSWAGAAVYENGEEWGGVDSSGKAAWGYATVALPDANPWLWDRGSSLTVKTWGTLTSATEAAIDADPTLNLIALASGDGWELLNYANASLTGTDGAANLYTLTSLKRGRRGTEWATGGHTAYDAFVLVEDLTAQQMGASDIGNTFTFKAQSFGLDPEDAPAITVPFEGDSLKPYAPARVTWVYDGTDLQGTITRRTRVGGAWVGGTTIPLSENSEEYEVDVMDGSDVVRTISVSGTNVFSYTSAMAGVDGVSLPTPPTVNVYQLSDAVGRGFALAA